MLQLAPGHMYVEAETLDTNAFLLNCANGTLDLMSGELRPANPDDLISKISPIEYEPGATCSEWDSVVLDICCGDMELMRYIQRVIGYSVTGEIREQVMFVFSGTGANGKDTILGRVRKALGDYCGIAAPNLLVKPTGERHPTEITDLRSQRLVIASESSEGAKLYEAQVKLFTGSDVLKGRRMGGDFYEFPNTSKIVLMTNHRPTIEGTDYGIWRRLHIIPFNQRYVKGENRDDSLWDRLDANELPGILNWCIEGCIQWQEHSLSPPEIVLNATQDYRQEQDILGEFFDECCTFTRTSQVTAKALYKKYKDWCEDAGERAQSQKWIWPKLTERGVSKKRQGGGFLYLGVALDFQSDDHY
jgi:putative DNA primase/helicase